MVPTALRGGLQSCGQNCAGAERFIVAAPLFEAFCSRVAAVVRQLRQVRLRPSWSVVQRGGGTGSTAADLKL